MMILPTGPRDRTGEEPEYGGLGGGFRDYGRNSRGGDRDRGFGGGFNRDEGRKSYGGFDDDRKQSRGGGDRDQPSRADEADNWGSTKKSYGGFDDDRKQFRGSGDRDQPSRADEADNWGSTKKFVSSAPVDSFERRRHDDRGERFDGGGAPISRADEVDNWGSGKKFVPSAAPPDRRSMGFGFNKASDSERWGRRDYKDQALDSERWGRRESQRDDARPTERPRIVLNPPRTGPPSVANSAVSSDVPKPTRANPFGLARPREEVLAEKGKLGSENEARDENMNSSKPTSSHSSCPGTPNLQSESSEEGNEYLKMDSQLEHLQIDRGETDREIKEKEEMNALKDQGTVNGNQPTLRKNSLNEEQQLELIKRDSNDKAHLVQRSGDGPVSAACSVVVRSNAFQTILSHMKK